MEESSSRRAACQPRHPDKRARRASGETSGGVCTPPLNQACVSNPAVRGTPRNEVGHTERQRMTVDQPLGNLRSTPCMRKMHLPQSCDSPCLNIEGTRDALEIQPADRPTHPEQQNRSHGLLWQRRREKQFRHGISERNGAYPKRTLPNRPSVQTSKQRRHHNGTDSYRSCRPWEKPLPDSW